MSWVERYHNRLHSTLGMVPPAEYEEAYWVGTLHSSSHLRGVSPRAFEESNLLISRRNLEVGNHRLKVNNAVK